MEREKIIDELNGQIETLSRLHVRHGLHGTEGYNRHKESVAKAVKEYGIDVRRELKPEVQLLYRRYFE